MKVKDILNQKHTVLNSVDGYTEHQGLTDYTQVDFDLRTILFVLAKKYKEAIDKLRMLPYHSDLQLEYKQEFPTWFVGGTFPMEQTEDKDILTYSNILAIDIDKKDNRQIDLENVVNKIYYDLPYVFGKPKSISGEGYYVLVLVENGRNTIAHYRYLQKLFKKIYNVNIDPQCKNIGRKRFISYQDDIDEVIKQEDIDIIPFKLLDNESDMLFDTETMNRMIDYKPHKFNVNDKIEFARKAIWKLLDDGYSVDNFNSKNLYSIWYYVGCEFRKFDDGYEMFVKFSHNTSKYNDSLGVIKKEWDKTKDNNDIDDVCRKWCGICKNKYGINWWKNEK